MYISTYNGCKRLFASIYIPRYNLHSTYSIICTYITTTSSSTYHNYPAIQNQYITTDITALTALTAVAGLIAAKPHQKISNSNKVPTRSYLAVGEP